MTLSAHTDRSNVVDLRSSAARSRARALAEPEMQRHADTSEQVVTALRAYASSSMAQGHGRTAMEIGVEMLTRVGSLTTPDEVVASTLKALRSPEGGECLPELLLASFGVMTLNQDMPDHAREQLIGLVESCFVAIDEQAVA